MLHRAQSRRPASGLLAPRVVSRAALILRPSLLKTCSRAGPPRCEETLEAVVSL